MPSSPPTSPPLPRQCIIIYHTIYQYVIDKKGRGDSGFGGGGDSGGGGRGIVMVDGVTVVFVNEVIVVLVEWVDSGGGGGVIVVVVEGL